MAPSISSAFLVLAAAVAPSHATIAAWWNGIGPQIILQNSTTGAIRHSACNAFGVPTYSHTDSSELPLVHVPKKGTPLAGTGWWNEKTTTASLFYVSKENKIINSLFECNMQTGLFNSKGSWVTSQPDFPVGNDTGLAALLLGAEDGYRVYYHDDKRRVNEIGYTQETDWVHRKILSQDPQGFPAIGAFRANTPANISVVSARDPQNMMVMRNAADESWYLSTFPRPLSGNFSHSEADAASITLNETSPLNFTLNAWDGASANVGLTIDNQFTRFVWYIGTDRALHQVRSKSFVWSNMDSQPAEIWPLADVANGELAVSGDQKNSVVRMYYFVQGRLAEVKFENNAWKPWKAVAEPQPITISSNPSGPAPPTDTSGPETTAEAATAGLTTGAKAGIAVGVIVGVIALAAVGFFVFLAKRRKNAQDKDLPEAAVLGGPSEVPAPPYGSRQETGAPGYDAYGAGVWEKKDQYGVAQYPPADHLVHQLDGMGRPMEMDAAPKPMYELPDQTTSHELVGDQRR